MPGDVVVYYYDSNGDNSWEPGEPIEHSARVEEVDNAGNTIIVSGKMGQGPEARNHPRAPGYYSTYKNPSTQKELPTSRAYFRRKDEAQKDKDKKKKKKSSNSPRPLGQDEVVEVPAMAFYIPNN